MHSDLNVKIKVHCTHLVDCYVISILYINIKSVHKTTWNIPYRICSILVNGHLNLL